jgi:hypothetical protein
VLIQGPAPGLLTNQNVSVTGKATDGLSGVAALQAAVDNGAFAPISLSASGEFNYSTSLAVDGSADGNHTVHVRATDRAGNVGLSEVPFRLDTTAPAIAVITPAPGPATRTNVTVAGQVTDNLGGVAALEEQVDAGPFAPVSFDPSGNFSFATSLALDGSADGSHTVRLRATDGAGNVSGLTDVDFTLDTRPPTVNLTGPAPGTTTNTNVTVAGQVTDSLTSVASVEEQVDGGPFAPVSFDSSGQFSFATALAVDGSADGSHTVHVRAADRAGNVSGLADVSFTLDTLTPPDPSTVAPPLDRTVATTLAASSAFLYTGSNPIQKGVAPGTINPVRVAVLRGRVLTRDGTPLPRVAVTVLGHPEFGSTLTRADGMFDLVVNGGGLLTVQYVKDGYLNAQRQVEAPWQDYAWLPDVVLVQADAQVTAIDLTAATPIQVARGNPVTDASGTRQTTLLFAQGTQAAMTLPDGTSQPLTTLHVRATEYSVGPSGPQALPADLPPSSGYTYAVEFSVDEAVAAGATGVTFDRPVISYVENFLHLPVGGAVPVASYDRSQGKWLPVPNGRIIQVLGATNGLADLDVDGSGQAAGAAALAALGITDAERQQLAGLYQPGQSLWRVPVSHFSPFDS